MLLQGISNATKWPLCHLLKGSNGSEYCGALLPTSCLNHSFSTSLSSLRKLPGQDHWDEHTFTLTGSPTSSPCTVTESSQFTYSFMDDFNRKLEKEWGKTTEERRPHLQDSLFSQLYSHLQIPAQSPGLCPSFLCPRPRSPGSCLPDLSHVHSLIWLRFVSQIPAEMSQKFSLVLCPFPWGQRSVSLFLCPSLSFCPGLCLVPEACLGLWSEATLSPLHDPIPAVWDLSGPSPALCHAHTYLVLEVGLYCQTTRTLSEPADPTQESFFLSYGFWNPGDLQRVHMCQVNTETGTECLSYSPSQLITFLFSTCPIYILYISTSVISYIQTHFKEKFTSQLQS